MVFDNCQRAWNSMGNTPLPPGFNPEKKTALEKLAGRYRRFMIIAGILIAYSFITFTRPSFIQDPTGRILLTSLFSFFALSALCIDWYIYDGIKSINCYRMTVKEVGEKAYRLRRIHLRSICFLLPLVLGSIGLLGYYVMDNVYTLYGMIAGTVIGTVIGLKNLREFMAEYKVLTDNEE